MEVETGLKGFFSFFIFLLSRPCPLPEIFSQDLDIHYLKGPLPLEGQEEFTVGSRRKGEVLGQMQVSRFMCGPVHQERPIGDLTCYETLKYMHLPECPRNPAAMG